MRLPKLSPAVARRVSTTAGPAAVRVAAQDELGPCGGICDPNDNKCPTFCQNCTLNPQTNQYTCQV